MKHYKWTLQLEYELDAENEEEFICFLADEMRRDWPEFIDDGDIVEIPVESIARS